MLRFLELVWGTIVYRPYVYGFFVCFFVLAVRHMRLRSTILYTVTTYLIAFVCEYSSTRNGFPFGLYTYIDDTRSRELWISNVPFWDSLSFVFLSYFSWIVASSIISPQEPSQALLRFSTAPLAGLLMMILDIVIDPLTLEGDKWFLGRIYYYPDGGTYFGVTLTNFAGWFFVGAAIVFTIQCLSRFRAIREIALPVSQWRTLTALDTRLSLAVYTGVLVFNLAITLWIKRYDIFAASLVTTLITLACVAYLLSRSQSPRITDWKTA